MDKQGTQFIIKAIDACSELYSMIGRPGSEEELYKLVDDIMPVVDRMMPKLPDIIKPIISEEGIAYEKCPTCGRSILGGGQKYCHNCGQALAQNERGKFFTWENVREWGTIYDPMLGKEVMTYCPEGTPAFDSYTAPFMDDDGDIVYHRYDHDAGTWMYTYYVLSDEEYQYMKLTGKEIRFRL